FEYFKFSTEAKLAVGITNVMVNDNTEFSTIVQRMNSKIISVSLHFEGGKWEDFAGIVGKIMWWKK
ncbi:MAG: hypothetical protein HY738_22260, partial [Bacteroidia bacterium]|nr:hypothetical protein [Bacteroidia bacterium]